MWLQLRRYENCHILTIDMDNAVKWVWNSNANDDGGVLMKIRIETIELICAARLAKLLSGQR